MKKDQIYGSKEEYESAFTLHFQKKRKKGVMAQVHFHNYIEILYATCGNFEIWLGGKYFEFEKGDLVVINSEEAHQILSTTDEESAYICVRFDPTFLYGTVKNLYDINFLLPFLTNHQSPQKIFKRSEIENTNIPDLMCDMLYEYSKKEFAYELAVRAEICSLFLWILRYWNKRGICTTSSQNYDLLNKLQPAIDYINANLGEQITTQQMAEYSNLSYSYFSRSFKDLTTMCFSNYLTFIRIRNAENLLLTTDLNITEIALETGFSTSSYFISQFKKQNGVSPKQYKKLFLSK